MDLYEEIAAKTPAPEKSFQISTFAETNYVDMNTDLQRADNNACAHARYTSSCSSASGSDVFSSRMDGELERRRIDTDGNSNETLYTEIAICESATEKTAGRITRQSDNPILRQEFVEQVRPINRAVSLNSNLHYRSMNDLFVESACTIECKCASNCHIHYENTRRNTDYFRCKDKRLLVSEKILNPEYANMTSIKAVQKPKKRLSGSSKSKSRQSIYDNESMYAKVLKPKESSRERTSSKPIDIARNSSNEFEHYSYIDERTCFSISSSSLHSSVGSMSSGASSDVSSLVSSSLSPPPLPSCRRRLERFSSWSNMATFSGLNYFRAHYLGCNTVTKVTKEIIDSAVGYVAQNTNVLEMKPVYVEVTYEFVRFGTTSAPWELLVSFPIEDIINFAVILKNAYFLGIITGKPSEDAMCYVLHTDKANEIADVIRETFQMAPKVTRAKSMYEISKSTIGYYSFPMIIKVGSTRVKKCFPVVNDYIEMVLQKANPKDLKSVDLEILGTRVVVKSQNDEEKHCIAWILSLGVFNDDNRYFGYIISECSSATKTRVQCHVYKAARNMTAIQVVDTISMCCQNTSTPKSSVDINPIYASYQPPKNCNNLSKADSHKKSETLLELSLSRVSPKVDNLNKDDSIEEIEDKGSSLERLDSGISDDAVFDNTQGCQTKIETKSKNKRKMIFGKIRRSIGSKGDDSPTSLEKFQTTSIVPETVIFRVRYVCSTVIKAPLRAKHVRECYKQFMKEFTRSKPNTQSDITVDLRIVTNNAVFMLDAQKSDVVIKNFPRETIGMFLVHPDGFECFAFSTADLDQKNKHKMHMFRSENSKFPEITRAFHKLLGAKLA